MTTARREVLNMAKGDWEIIMRLPVAMVLAGEDGRILTVNDALGQLVGYSETEL